MKSINKKYSVIIIALFVVLAVFFFSGQVEETSQNSEENSIISPYAGQESRGIKSLSETEIEGLLAGAGTPFGGMAKLGELNGYPGPKHVLEAVEFGEFELTEEQLEKIENLYEEMRSEAIELGTKIIEIEQRLDDSFADKSMTLEVLESEVTKSAELYGQLRFLHLKYHLFMVDILTSEQVEKYNELRGYNSENPCEDVPEGHDPEMWKLHHGCN